MAPVAFAYGAVFVSGNPVEVGKELVVGTGWVVGIGLGVEIACVPFAYGVVSVAGKPLEVGTEGVVGTEGGVEIVRVPFAYGVVWGVDTECAGSVDPAHVLAALSAMERRPMR